MAYIITWKIVGTKSVNLPIIATETTIMLKEKIKYFATAGISANFINKIRVIDTNSTITVPSPAFNPKTLVTNSKPSSGVDGMNKFETEIFSGTANFKTFAIALIENKVKRVSETIRACRLRLGNLFLIPLPKIAPCNNPILTITINVIRKFSSAMLTISNY